MRAVSATLVSLACLSLAATAGADNGKGQGHGHGHEKGPVIVEHDRPVVPPGQAKRLWAIGSPLASTVAFYPLPPVLLARLTPAPAGYQYVRVDDDVLLIATATRIVSRTAGNFAALQDTTAPLVPGPDRDAIVAYYRSDYIAGNCPDGLMRTDHGCQAKPLWALGAPLEPSVTYEVLPEPLRARLSPPPDGMQYIRLGDHVLLMAVETRLIRADILDLAHFPAAQIAVAPPPAGVVVQERIDYIGGGSGGFCPPGLAKKNNGCLPPGHAR